MNALLICPADRPAVRFLAQAGPLAAVHAFGKPLIVHWLEHLSALGAKRVFIIASDRLEQIRAAAGDGRRWGLRLDFVSHPRELTPDEARSAFKTGDDWLSGPGDVALMDHFPGLPDHPLFKSYANWFNGLRAWLPIVTTAHHSEAHEVTPGVWVSPRARVSAMAELRAPCWIGPHTIVGADTIIGPMAVLEDRVMVESNVEITNSSVAPETFVGKWNDLRNSIADASLLINWRTASCTRVSDPFILCALPQRLVRVGSTNLPGRALALLAMLLTLPFALLPVLRNWLRRRPVFHDRVAVRPFTIADPGLKRTLVYRELAHCRGWLRDWPQLWNIVRGEFAWVGNRPLSPAKVAKLANDFERLWLAAHVGLFSLAHVEGAVDALEARACASLYALKASWRLDLAIIARACLLSSRRPFAALF